MREIQPGLRFASRITLSVAGISAFARDTGDDNPLHHDARYASRTRYGGVVASGGHTSALLLGLAASQFSRETKMVGLEFAFRFRKPVYAPQRVTAEWLVIRTRDAPRLGGILVELRGRLQTESGQTAVGAQGKVLVTEQL